MRQPTPDPGAPPAAPLIAIVGVCAAGKTTLAAGLRSRGYHARDILQEHSYVPAMWQRITRPDVLVYLDASLAAVRQRRRDPEFPRDLYEQELARLRHAREHCHLYIHTDALTPAEVLAAALDGLARQGVMPGGR
ncbi:MAG: hypothetical protein BWY52_01037 [Chloroflexi bacterium ADurb.Bin325]|nr:MAG: hypothetical protein BWY52_01037 [Chloroflexi bacterium ADurb.Bin325]